MATLTENTLEAALAYYASQNTAPIADSRRETLGIAIVLGACAGALQKLCDAGRVGRGTFVILPAHHLEGLSRGRGWCRQGIRDQATWGERVYGGYRVETTGNWTVGGNDGFNRKGETSWSVERVTVGNQTWTVAN